MELSLWTFAPRPPPPSNPGSCGSLANPRPSGRGKKAAHPWNPIAKLVVDKLNACFPGEIAERATHEKAGASSDHPASGDAADCFSGKFGAAAAGQEKEDGDKMADWLVANAGSLKVKYVIWHARIWSQACSDEGWRECDSSAATRYGGSDPVQPRKGHTHASALQVKEAK